ncbi:unnamed protein product [Schistosoma mattheei]|uniref:Uncharacterized protein n=1 Tax=Schistosoma mattheei TaxID=31246 RepID=A0A3P8GRP7_9TREM|nr:unnamed protein product [Schistosoma mattheei]
MCSVVGISYVYDIWLQRSTDDHVISLFVHIELDTINFAFHCDYKH